MSALSLRPSRPLAARVPSPRWTARGVRAAYRCELAKLLGLLRVRLAVLACVLGPFALVLVLRAQTTLPTDTLFGRWVHDSGLAVPLLVLGFAGLWAVPALTSVVAGDVFASEDRFGTWTLLAARSRSRSEVFAAKVLATVSYTVAVVVLLALCSVAAGLLLVGHQPLVGLSGQPIGAERALGLVLLAWAGAVPPALAFACLGLLVSVVTRSGPAGVGLPVLVSLAGGLLALVAVPGWLRLALPSTPFGDWHGLFLERATGDLLVWGTLTSLVWAGLCLGVAYAVFVRRTLVAG